MPMLIRVLASSIFLAAFAFFDCSNANATTLASSPIVRAILQEKCADVLPGVERLSGVDKVEMQAVLYDRGCGVNQDMPHALRLYRQALSMGAIDDRAHGYVDLFSGEASRGVVILMRAARAGDPFAPTILGWYYQAASDVFAEDDKKRWYWLEFASKSGDIAAAVGAGQDDYYGAVGVPKNADRGMQLLIRALDADDPLALEWRGYQLTYGTDGVGKNLPLGMYYFRRAIAKGSALATIAVAQQYSDADVKAGLITPEEAISLARDAASRLLPSVPGNADLGMVLLRTRLDGSAPPNCAEAVPLLVPAENDRSPEVDQYLTMCYLYPLGVIPDRAKAEHYAREGQRKGWRGALAYIKGADAYYAIVGSGIDQTKTAQRIKSMTQQYLLLHPSVPGQ